MGVVASSFACTYVFCADKNAERWLVVALPPVYTSLLAVNICHRLTLAAPTAQKFIR
jgi:hypothetical protein